MTLYEFNSTTLDIINSQTMPNFRAYTMLAARRYLLIGGSSLKECSLAGVASVLRLTGNDPPQAFWTDDDLFESEVRGIVLQNDDYAIAISHTRAAAIEPGSSKELLNGYKKRWGDDLDAIREASLVLISRAGQVRGRHFLLSGFNIYLQGLLRAGDDLLTFGTMGGEPAIAMPLACRKDACILSR